VENRCAYHQKHMIGSVPWCWWAYKRHQTLCQPRRGIVQMQPHSRRHYPKKQVHNSQIPTTGHNQMHRKYPTPLSKHGYNTVFLIFK